MRRIVVLISGRGSNLRAILDASRAEAWGAGVVAVIADRPEAGGLAFAAEAGAAAEIVPFRDHADRAAFDRALAERIDAHAPDVVVLAGFMRVLGAAFVERYQGRLVNIHPSLLPAFPGLHTHRRALQAGVRMAGATVHLVTADLDHGPILAQSVVPVMPGDTESVLAARVLASEHRIFPRAVRWLAEGRVRVHEGVVEVDGVDPAERLVIAAP